jgi:hypothetical protein
MCPVLLATIASVNGESIAKLNLSVELQQQGHVLRHISPFRAVLPSVEAPPVLFEAHSTHALPSCLSSVTRPVIVTGAPVWVQWQTATGLSVTRHPGR